jgi:zinc transporter, ZIP family
MAEPIGALLGAAVIGLSATPLPRGLAFAAGAMLCVVCHALIPGMRGDSAGHAGTIGLMPDFCLMMLLDTALA